METKTLSNFTKWSWCAGNTGNQLYILVYNAFTTLILNVCLGLDLTAVSTIVGTGAMIDMIVCYFLGNIISNTNSRFGKYRPWSIFSSVATVIASVFFFSGVWIPISGSLLVPVGIVLYALANLTLDATVIAHNSQLQNLTNDPQLRIWMTAKVQQLGAVASTVSGWILMPLVYFFGRSSEVSAAGFTGVLVVYGLAVILFAWLEAAGAKDYDRQQPETDKRSAVNPIKVLGIVFGNRDLCLYTLHNLAFFVFKIVMMTMTTYMFMYVIRDAQMLSVYNGAGYILSFIGATFAPALIRRFAKKGSRVLAMLIRMAGIAFCFLFRGQPILALCGACFSMLGESIVQTSMVPMYLDNAEAIRLEKGVDITGIAMTINQVCIKLGSTLAGFLTPLLLAWTGFTTAEALTDAISSRIGILYLIVPMILGVISIICILLYRLTDEKLAAMRAGHQN